MKYEDIIDSKEGNPSILSESMIVPMNTQTNTLYDSASVPQDTLNLTTSYEDMPCTYTDDEMHRMLEDIENEDVFIPDSLVRKMFA